MIDKRCYRVCYRESTGDNTKYGKKKIRAKTEQSLISISLCQISVYQPSMLIVGTRGMSELKGMFINSVSKYCLQHSPIPVVVVRPEDKIKKQQTKKPKKANRLSGMFRIGSHSSLSSLNSKGSESSDSEVDEDEPAAIVEKKMQRLSVFEKIGRRSRSPSPSRPKKQQ